MATVIIPTPLRKFTNNTARLQVGSGTIHSTVQELTLNFPDLKKHLLDEGGNIRSYVNIFIGNDDIRAFLARENPAALAAIANCFARLHEASLWVTRRNSIAASLREAS